MTTYAPPPETLPKYVKEKVLFWDDERHLDHSIIITLKHGWCMEEEGSHVKGFENQAKVKEYFKHHVHPCACGRCNSPSRPAN